MHLLPSLRASQSCHEEHPEWLELRKRTGLLIYTTEIPETSCECQGDLRIHLDTFRRYYCGLVVTIGELRQIGSDAEAKRYTRERSHYL
jgi:hypothetical protein